MANKLITGSVIRRTTTGSAATMVVPEPQPEPVASAPAIAHLLTKKQVIERIRMDIARTSLTEVAVAHELSPQQLSDIVRGRANLSKKATSALGWRLWEYYEKVGS